MDHLFYLVLAVIFYVLHVGMSFVAGIVYAAVRKNIAMTIAVIRARFSHWTGESIDDITDQAADFIVNGL